MIEQDTSENQANSIYVSIGSNLGNKANNIEKTKSFLLSCGIKIIKASSYYETLSWPDPQKPKYLNIVIQINTNLQPSKLLEIFKSIEKKLGRKKAIKNSPRECDIDIIAYGNKIIRNKLDIPHLRMHNRSFVLIPLYELNQNWVHPKLNINIKNLIFSLPIKDIRSIKQI